MLKELKNVRQIAGERPRRWFVDEDIELILWYGEDRKLSGFQVCYDKKAGTRSVTWKRITEENGETHSVLLSDGPFNKDRVMALVKRDSENLEEEVRQFILQRLETLGTHA
ncbi:MAG: hypothetical protein MI717_13865 [Spirochaetales bacterium]|nr:hypothetical protein [Spirochaetales bacterium]